MNRLFKLAASVAVLLGGATQAWAQQEQIVHFVIPKADSRAYAPAAEGERYPIVWQNDDEAQTRIRVNVNLAFGENGKRKTLDTPYVTAAPKSKGGEFKVAMDGYTADNYTFYAVAPYNGWYQQGEKPSSPARIRVAVPIEQTATAKACDPKARLLFGKSEPTTDLSKPVTLPFKHVTAYGCLSLQGVPANIKQVIIQGYRSNLTGRRNFDAEQGELIAASGGDSRNLGWRKVTVNTTSNEVWFATYPTDLSGRTVIICVVFDDNSYWIKTHKFRKEEGKFEAGCVKHFAVNFEKGNLRKYPSPSLYKENGEVKGIRYWASEDGKTAKVISLTRCVASPWCVDANGEVVTEPTGASLTGEDGTDDWKVLTKWLAANKRYRMPIYDFCKSLGEGWYWTNHNELRDLGLAYKFMGNLFDALLTDNGGDALCTKSTADGDETGDRYWSSREGRESKEGNAYWVRMDGGDEAQNNAGKNRTYFGRAVKVVPME